MLCMEHIDQIYSELPQWLLQVEYDPWVCPLNEQYVLTSAAELHFTSAGGPLFVDRLSCG